MPELPATPEVRVPVHVYYFDTDAGGVVHNANYLRFVEVGRSELADALGWSLAQMQQTGIVPVVARAEVDYLRPAMLDDDLEVRSWLEGMEKIRFYIGCEITRPADGALICRCRQTMVTVKLPSGRPQRAPQEWAEAYPKLLR